MKKVSVIDFEYKKVGETELPKVFNSVIREEIIHKVFEINKKMQMQPHGSYPLAGKETSASSKESHRRRKYKTLYGYGISRIPRKILTRRGDRFYWKGAFIPGTVGGRAAHPPKVLKKRLKINKKEKRIALKSAIAATAVKKILEKKYPKMNKLGSIELPVVIDPSILKRKTKDIAEFISKLFDIKKIRKKVRAGKGKRRGRRYKNNKKILKQ